jgi:hypothetical protein
MAAVSVLILEKKDEKDVKSAATKAPTFTKAEPANKKVADGKKSAADPKAAAEATKKAAAAAEAEAKKVAAAAAAAVAVCCRQAEHGQRVHLTRISCGCVLCLPLEIGFTFR